MTSCQQVIKPIMQQPTHALIGDLNTCKSVVQFEPSPVKKLLWDLNNLTRKRSLELVVGFGDARQLPPRMTLKHDQVYDLVQMSIRKRCKFNSLAKTADLLCLETSVVTSEPTRTPKPLLALEWKAEQSVELPLDFDFSQEDDEEENWFALPAMSVITEICEMTSKLGHQVPKAAMFLWAQFMQLLSCSKKYGTCEQTENDARGRSEVIREPSRGCYLSVCCRMFDEERNRALAEKKIKRQDTKKSLKRAHGAITQKYCNSTNRKRAMDLKRFQRGSGRRGC